jgi:hypothetical protein
MVFHDLLLLLWYSNTLLLLLWYSISRAHHVMVVRMIRDPVVMLFYDLTLYSMSVLYLVCILGFCNPCSSAYGILLPTASVTCLILFWYSMTRASVWYSMNRARC